MQIQFAGPIAAESTRARFQDVLDDRLTRNPKVPFYLPQRPSVYPMQPFDRRDLPWSQHLLRPMVSEQRPQYRTT